MDTHIMDRLSEHLDGDLSAEDSAAVEAHLLMCSECAKARDEILSVREAGRALPDWGPGSDLWPGILEQVEGARVGNPSGSGVIDLRVRMAERPVARRVGRQIRFTIPQLIAASVALIFLSGAGALSLRPSGSAVSAGSNLESPFAQLVSDGGGAEGIQDEVAALQELLEANRGELEENTVRILEKNLEIIDRAIDESRRALAQDPSSVFLQGHLADALERKAGYLREAARVIEAAA